MFENLLTLDAHDEKNMSSDRSFCLVFAVFSSLLSLFNYMHGGVYVVPLLVAAIALGILAFTRPEWLHSANILWTKLGLLLAKIVNPIFIGLIFFVVLTPIALLMRLLQKDLLKLAREPLSKTYWTPRKNYHEDAKNAYRHQF